MEMGRSTFKSLNTLWIKCDFYQEFSSDRKDLSLKIKFYSKIVLKFEVFDKNYFIINSRSYLWGRLPIDCRGLIVEDWSF